MLRPHEKKRLLIGTAMTVCVWIISAVFYLNVIDIPSDAGIVSYCLHWALVFLASYSIVFFFWVYPVFFIVGLIKLRDQKRYELEELGDENKVYDDPDGERKLHDYLTAITSTEARIGLLQRSDPWPGPAAEVAKVSDAPKWRFTKAAQSMMRLCVLFGLIAGALLGALSVEGINTAEATDTLKRSLLVRTVVSGVLGAVFATPLGWIAALLFGKTEPVEVTSEPGEEHDAGTGSPETT